MVQPDCLVAAIGDRLPHAAVSQFVDLYQPLVQRARRAGCAVASAGSAPVRWLVEAEATEHPKISDFRAWRASK